MDSITDGMRERRLNEGDVVIRDMGSEGKGIGMKRGETSMQRKNRKKSHCLSQDNKEPELSAVSCFPGEDNVL